MRLLEVSADRDDLEESHAEWAAHANRVMRQLDRSGTRVRRVIIDLDELIAWCKAEGRPVDGASRADFVSMKVGQETRSEPE
jgi:hypothetical protein